MASSTWLSSQALAVWVAYLSPRNWIRVIPLPQRALPMPLRTCLSTPPREERCMCFLSRRTGDSARAGLCVLLVLLGTSIGSNCYAADQPAAKRVLRVAADPNN